MRLVAGRKNAGDAAGIEGRDQFPGAGPQRVAVGLRNHVLEHQEAVTRVGRAHLGGQRATGRRGESRGCGSRTGCYRCEHGLRYPPR